MGTFWCNRIKQRNSIDNTVSVIVDDKFFTIARGIIKMCRLFDIKDVKSWSNCAEVKVGDAGYFGYNLQDLERVIKNYKTPKILSEINEDLGTPFKAEDYRGWSWYAFFLPVEKVRKSPYRPFNSVTELFSFLMPEFSVSENQEEFNEYKKAEILLSKKITLKQKEDNLVKVVIITEIYFYDNDDNTNIYLNSDLVKDLFCNYEILINGEFVPFGVEE